MIESLNRFNFISITVDEDEGMLRGNSILITKIFVSIIIYIKDLKIFWQLIWFCYNILMSCSTTWTSRSIKIQNSNFIWVNHTRALFIWYIITCKSKFIPLWSLMHKSSCKITNSKNSNKNGKCFSHNNYNKKIKNDNLFSKQLLIFAISFCIKICKRNEF